MSPLLLFRSLFDYMLQAGKKRFSASSDISLEEWIKSRFGKTLYEIYFKPYSEKLWGIPCSEISSDFASQRISLINLWDVLKRLLIKGGETPKTYATTFFYPAGGIGQIPLRIAEEIEKRGGKIVLRSKAVSIKSKGKRVFGVLIKRNQKEELLRGDFIIATIPISELVEILSPPDRIKEMAKELRFRSVVFLNIILNIKRVQENCWIYIPEKDYLIFRIQEPKNWHPENSPKEKTSLILEIACDYGDEIWDMDEKSLFAIAMSELARMGFNISQYVSSYFVTRLRYAYPVYFIGYKRILSEIIEHLLEYENLIVCGRQGLYRYNNMDHSMEMGMLSARCVLEELPKEEILKIAIEKESFEAKA
jgi:protoporphyrinogen oxidase